jgi:hypothetical protein
MLEEIRAAADDVVDIDQARTAGLIEHLPQPCLALFDWTAAQIMTVEMQQIEGEVGETPHSVALR